MRSGNPLIASISASESDYQRGLARLTDDEAEVTWQHALRNEVLLPIDGFANHCIVIWVGRIEVVDNVAVEQQVHQGAPQRKIAVQLEMLLQKRVQLSRPYSLRGVHFQHGLHAGAGDFRDGLATGIVPQWGWHALAPEPGAQGQLGVGPLKACWAEKVDGNEPPIGFEAPANLIERMLEVFDVVQGGFGQHHVIEPLAVVGLADVSTA